jgi:predicted DNA-binding transcriptional regulator YafY
VRKSKEGKPVKDVVIGYRDAKGSITSRRVSLIKRNGGDGIYAFCHLRRELRTFKITRILYAADPEKGELIEDLAAVMPRPL